MRILHTADWHLGRSLEQNNRLDEQASIMDELVLICRDQAVDLILVAGDVFDTYNPSAAAEQLFYDALERLADHGQRTVVVIAGNHDNPDRLCAAAPLAWHHGIILLGNPADDPSVLTARTGPEPGRLLAAGPGFLRLAPGHCATAASIVTLPFPSEARLQALASPLLDEETLQLEYSCRIGHLFAALSAACFRTETVNLSVSHLFTGGGWPSDSERTLQLGTGLMVLPEHLPAAAQYTALGHLHRPQAVTDSPSPARYAGSPLGYSFSEANSAKSVCLIDVQPGRQADVRTIELVGGRPLRKWIAREGFAQALDWAREGRDSLCWIDLEVWMDRLPTSAELRELQTYNPGILHIRPVLAAPDTGDVLSARRGDRRIEELFADFYRFRYGVDIPTTIQDTFITLINQPDEVDV